MWIRYLKRVAKADTGYMRMLSLLDGLRISRVTTSSSGRSRPTQI